MRIRYWGVRGSIPAPGAKTHKIGGHTACVEVQVPGQRLILDAGTGLRSFGMSLRSQGRNEHHLLLSHCHLDHMSGLPFFRPLHQKNATLHIYGPKGHTRSLRQTLKAFFTKEFFPVPFGELAAKIQLHSLDNSQVKIGNIQIRSFTLNHPGHTIGYLIESDGKRLAYVTDHEPIHHVRHHQGLTKKGFQEKILKHIDSVDVLIHDAQYLDHQYSRYRGWGHSRWKDVIDLANQADVKRLELFHHSPDNEDTLLLQSLKKLQQQLKRRKSKLRVNLAREGKVLDI